MGVGVDFLGQVYIVGGGVENAIIYLLAYWFDILKFCMTMLFDQENYLTDSQLKNTIN